jgi:hypothetical protein
LAHPRTLEGGVRVSALKRKLGENIQSKNRVARGNEVIRKLIAYKLPVVVDEMFENGIAPAFAIARFPVTRASA